ncbi:MAG TPA: hypothetical protein VGP33_04445 [Chloroflexota bacterium]|jgi:hypothetical protein|nr:hypothetical protein [Chloroflexota bacterium]
MPRVYASKVTPAELAALLEELGRDLRFAYLESVTASQWLRFGQSLPLTEAVRGRVFGPGCEVQFERIEGGIRLTVLADALPATTLPGSTLDLTNHDADQVTYLLWGQYAATADAWVEPGFQRRWHYPLEGHPSRVGVYATEYREHASGDLQFVRYVDLVAIEDVA